MAHKQAKRGGDLGFTDAELLAELEREREKCRAVGFQFTEAQRKFIIAARSGQKPVPYAVILRLWDKRGWPKISATRMRQLGMQLTIKQ